jgi:two-component system, NtrC family, response regulator AtoC
MKARILVIEDERSALNALALLLEDEGYEVLRAETGEEGLRLALREEPDLLLLDIRLPDIDGLTVLRRLREGYSNAAVIVMTAETLSSNAIQATHLGAFDYIAKPLNDEHLLVLIQRALEYRRLEQEIQALRGSASKGSGIPGIVGHSLAMQEVYKLIGRVADTDATVFIQGESGTGKELVASAIHEFSTRASRPMVRVNCAAIPEPLLEAELFGHERGAFTNAVARRIGRFEQASGGTLFLDEVAELPMAVQAKLLRAVQERCIERLGNNNPIPVDLRIISASAQDLSVAVAEGRFREDLFYRLNVVRIELPPLRERTEDIPFLIQHFLARAGGQAQLREDALQLLISHSWPGNVRELENVVTRAMVLAPGGLVTPDCIELKSPPADTPRDWAASIPHHEGYKEVLRRVEEHMLRSALREAGGNKSEAARILKIHRRLLYDRAREFGLV